MITCPNCQQTERQVKSGLNRSGSQRYLCRWCGRLYTPEPKRHGYPAQLREQAVQHYVDGVKLRRIGRMLGVDRQTVANWVKAHGQDLPATAAPTQADTVELDERFTFVGKKDKPSTS